jgi:selenocysteine-specific elongation factor
LFVIGTAGHVDHGKSTLIKALTGINPDRLAEEQLREMTIELGFAWLNLPGGLQVGVVDVPGHEHFIKNMLAGVSGMDLVMLVVAANEAIKPQTREHLAILDLMEVPALIAVITQADLADADQIALVGMEIDDLLEPTRFKGAPVVPVSAVTGQGLEDLKKCIENTLHGIQPRRDIGKARLPVDRVFTIAGSGTIVTGTLVDGPLTTGQEIEIQPGSLKSRIRGLQTHKTALNSVSPGNRVAVNLTGLSPSELHRGQVVSQPGWLTETRLIDARLSLLADLPRPLKHNTEVSLHTGSAETMARIRLLEKEAIQPGETSWVQFILDEPLAVLNGDKYVIRSPMDTLGGGSIVDTHPKERYRRFRMETIENLKIRGEGKAEAALLAALKAKQPQEREGLLSQTSLTQTQAASVLDDLISSGQVVALGEGTKSLLFTASAWQQIAENIAALVRDYHRKYPLRLGIPKAEINSRIKLGSHLQEGLQLLIKAGIIAEENALVHLAGRSIKLTREQQAAIGEYLKQLDKNPYSPAPEINLEADLLNLLVENRRVVRTVSGVVFSAAAFNEMSAKVLERLKQQGKVTVAEARDMLQSSRKYVLAVLEQLDEKKLTKRSGDDRIAGEKLQ